MALNFMKHVKGSHQVDNKYKDVNRKKYLLRGGGQFVPVGNAKIRAQRTLQYHVRVGHILKPDRCSICKNSNNSLVAHHTNYEQPLNVVWLCSRCHPRPGGEVRNNA